MENESAAKIAIRGKGSVKEGKGKSDAAHASNQDEDLHCLIMADTEDKVNKAKQLIHNVIETVSIRNISAYSSLLANLKQAASIPEGQNELKRNQLRELAALNGTLRDDENQACQNCGEIGHRKYDCPQARNFTANIICRVCGNAGHMARDCPDRARGSDWRNMPPRRPAGIGGPEDEYEKLMNELGGGTTDPGRQIGWQEGSADAAGGPPQGDSRPWQRGPTGGPAPWANRGQPSGAPLPSLAPLRHVLPSIARMSQLLRLPGAVCDADISTLGLPPRHTRGATARCNLLIRRCQPTPSTGHCAFRATRPRHATAHSARYAARAYAPVPVFDEMLPMTLFCCAAACRPLGRA